MTEFLSSFFPLGILVVVDAFGSSHPRANLRSLTCLARGDQERIPQIKE